MNGLPGSVSKWETVHFYYVPEDQSSFQQIIWYAGKPTLIDKCHHSPLSPLLMSLLSSHFFLCLLSLLSVFSFVGIIVVPAKHSLTLSLPSLHSCTTVSWYSIVVVFLCYLYIWLQAENWLIVWKFAHNFIKETRPVLLECIFQFTRNKYQQITINGGFLFYHSLCL